MERIDRISWLVALSLFALGCGGSDTTALVIANEQGEGDGLEITSVLIQDCITRYWDLAAIGDDYTHPVTSPVTIAHGDSQTFDLAPGCHDVLVKRGNGTGRDWERFSAARVVLDRGETVNWVPFRVNDNDTWWCQGDCDDK